VRLNAGAMVATSQFSTFSLHLNTPAYTMKQFADC